MAINNIIVNCTTGQEAADTVNAIITCVQGLTGAGLVAGPCAGSLQSRADLTPAGASAGSPCGIAIGNGAQVLSQNSVSLGLNACVGSGGSPGIAIGAGAITDGFAYLPERQGIAIGAGSVANASSQAIGGLAKACNQSIAIGGAAEVIGGCQSLAIGLVARTPSCRSVSIGFCACACAACTVAMGARSCSTNSNAVTIGAGSTGGHVRATVLGSLLSSVVECSAHVERLHILTTDTYADNAAAIAGGLTGGQVYKTCTGTLQIVY